MRRAGVLDESGPLPRSTGARGHPRRTLLLSQRISDHKRRQPFSLDRIRTVLLQRSSARLRKLAAHRRRASSISAVAQGPGAVQIARRFPEAEVICCGHQPGQPGADCRSTPAWPARRNVVRRRPPTCSTASMANSTSIVSNPPFMRDPGQPVPIVTAAAMPTTTAPRPVLLCRWKSSKPSMERACVRAAACCCTPASPSQGEQDAFPGSHRAAARCVLPGLDVRRARPRRLRRRAGHAGLRRRRAHRCGMAARCQAHPHAQERPLTESISDAGQCG